MSFTPFQHLVSAVVPFEHQGYMVMLTAYYDESGDDNDPKAKICGMAGAIATKHQWDRLEVKWKARLDLDGLEYFHMKEYAHSTGIFTEWKSDEDRRRKLLADLWSLIEEVNPIFCGAFIPLEYYRDSLDGWQKSQLIGAYFLTYQACIATAFVTFQSDYGDQVEEMITVFDDKKDYRQHINNFYVPVITAAECPFLSFVICVR